MKQEEAEQKREVLAPEQKVGRFLGKAVGKLRRTKTWKNVEKAYKEGREGKG